jgi:hypothetical protein
MGSKRKQKKPKSEPKRPILENSETPELSDEEFKKRFPHLLEELGSSKPTVQVEGVRWDETDRTQQSITTGKSRFAGYSPDVVDFLRRCATDEEALEIINYLEKRKEINANHAKALREQLRARGVRSFGSKKSWGHYERKDSP